MKGMKEEGIERGQMPDSHFALASFLLGLRAGQ
jgi:hypothetical protein